MLLAEVVVEPEVGLILSVGFGGGSDEIVGARDVGHGVVLQNLVRERIEAAGRDGIARKLSAGRRKGIEDSLREDPLALRQCGNHAKARDAGAEPGALPVREEESLVLLDRRSEEHTS